MNKVASLKVMMHIATFLSSVARQLFPAMLLEHFPIESGQLSLDTLDQLWALCLTWLPVYGNIAQQQCSKSCPLYHLEFSCLKECKDKGMIYIIIFHIRHRLYSSHKTMPSVYTLTLYAFCFDVEGYRLADTVY